MHWSYGGEMEQREVQRETPKTQKQGWICLSSLVKLMGKSIFAQKRWI